MTDRGILFSAPMVRAILDGEKTQSRRIIASDGVHECGWVSGPCRNVSDGSLADGEDGAWAFGKTGVGKRDPGNFFVEHRVVPPYNVGDTLWVREAWRAPSDYDHVPPRDVSEWAPLLMLADERHRGGHVERPGRYRHARFMPRWASRIDLRVTSVRVERLGEISAADCIAEGAVHAFRAAVTKEPTWHPLRCFPWLWCQVHGPDAWERDGEKWTWVYTFEVAK